MLSCDLLCWQNIIVAHKQQTGCQLWKCIFGPKSISSFIACFSMHVLGHKWWWFLEAELKKKLWLWVCTMHWLWISSRELPNLWLLEGKEWNYRITESSYHRLSNMVVFFSKQYTYITAFKYWRSRQNGSRWKYCAFLPSTRYTEARLVPKK